MIEKNFKDIDRIIVMSLAPLNKTLIEAIFLNIFIELGIKIEFWSLTKVLTGVEYNEEICVYQDSEINIRHIKNREHLKLSLSEINTDNTLINVQIYFESRFYWFFKMLTRSDLIYFVSIVGVMPSVSLTERSQQLSHSPKLFLKKGYLKLMKIIVSKFELIKKPEFAFVAGSIAEKISSSKKNISVNSRDYDHVSFSNKHNDLKFNDGRKYIVYIDQGVGRHPDDAIINKKVNEKLDQYYIKLNLFFDTLEKLNNMKIIVAGHPRIKNNFQFGHRAIIKDKTLDLISGAEFVLAQCSTAISFAIMKKKPILFFFSDYMREGEEMDSLIYSSIKALSNELGCNLINIDYYQEHTLIFKKDSKLYSQYKYQYLTSTATENLSNYEIMSDIFVKNKR